MVFITGDTLRPTTPRDYFHQLPFFVSVAAACGLFGATFNAIQARTARFRPSARQKIARMCECVVVVLATVAIRFAASAYAGQCIVPPDTWKKDDFGVRFNCPEGEINDIATVFFAYPGRSIGWMFGMAEHVWGEAYGFTARGLAIAAACYLVMMALAFGIAVPGGLFMPSLFLGACAGGCAGLTLKSALPESWDIQPGLYALIGATSALGGVFRSSVSLVVIMVESTNGQAFVFAIIVAVVVSNIVGNYFASGIYHAELSRSKTVAYLPREPSSALDDKTVRDVMAVPPAILPEIAHRDAAAVAPHKTRLTTGSPSWTIEENSSVSSSVRSSTSFSPHQKSTRLRTRPNRRKRGSISRCEPRTCAASPPPPCPESPPASSTNPSTPSRSNVSCARTYHRFESIVRPPSTPSAPPSWTCART